VCACREEKYRMKRMKMTLNFHVIKNKLKIVQTVDKERKINKGVNLPFQIIKKTKRTLLIKIVIGY
jgi:hypothetical protein